MTDLWYALQDHNKYVYHYTGADVLVKHILPNNKLRFSKFASVNDPRESKNWIFSFSSCPSDLNSDEVNRQLNSIIKHSYRIGCFVSDNERAVYSDNAKSHGSNPLMALYERGHSRPRMWAQYGGNYQGACLIFRKNELDKSINEAAHKIDSKVYSRHVAYSNPNLLFNLNKPHALIFPMLEAETVGLESAAKMHVEKHKDSFFYLKSEDWSQEREYRWVVTSRDDDSDFYCDIENALSGILLGDRFPEKLKPNVGKFAEQYGLSVAVMDWQNGLPQPKPNSLAIADSEGLS